MFRPDIDAPRDGPTGVLEYAEVPATDETFDARILNRGAFRAPWSSGGRGSTRRRGKPRPRATVLGCIAWLALMIFFAIAAEWLPIHNPYSIIGLPNVGPHWGRELFGTDAIGRSMLSRLVYGARASLGIGFAVSAIAMVVGGAIGLLAVYFRGTVNVLADLFANTIFAIPGLLLLLTLVLVFGQKIPVLIGSIALLFIPGFMRVTRATAIRQIESEYVSSALGLGATPFRIISRELMPNTIVALVTFFALALPNAMLAEGGLSYLGFGVPTPTPSWGQMIAQGTNLEVAPWGAITPCIFFTLTVFAFYTVGDWLRVKFDFQD